MPDAAVIQKENDDMTQPFKEKPPRVELRGSVPPSSAALKYAAVHASGDRITEPSGMNFGPPS